jgi:hypothetical protein
MFSGACLTEERIECIVAASNCLVRRHLAVRLDAMLKTEKLPACIADLDSALSEVKAKDLTHCVNEAEEEFERESSGEVPEVKQLDVCRVM